jgi:hypothetical protein
MVVLLVTLFLRVTMRRPTEFSALFSLLKATSAGALVLAFAVACSDSNGPRVPKDGIPVDVEQVDLIVPDSLKQAQLDQFTATLLSAPHAISPSAFAAPGAVLSTSAAVCGGGSSDYTVTKLAPPFTPEPIPIYTPSEVVTQDGYIKDLPVGFDFVFFGNTYHTVNVFSNGYLEFGKPENDVLFNGDNIPNPTLPNNIIAFAWVDWEPRNIPGGIRFETRGSAPNRMFIIQFTNVPEYAGRGNLMAQVVLHEGSNAITMYTNTVNITKMDHRLTQGIENADGTADFRGPLVEIAPGLFSPRVKAVYRLTEDAIRFTPVRVTDTQKPTITAPADITANNDPRLASAVVATGSPVAEDNCTPDVPWSGKRSDGRALDAPYPVGETIITWTATDAAGNTATALQSIKVVDIEAPELTVPNSYSVNATSSSGAKVPYTLSSWDNVGVTSLTCEPPSGSTLPIGNNSVKCTAADAAGNSTVGTFGVFVIDANGQMSNLIEYLTGLGLPNGSNNPLLNELELAFGNIGQDISCKKLSDFQRMLIKKSSDIPSESVAYMTGEATRIMVVMECSKKM